MARRAALWSTRLSALARSIAEPASVERRRHQRVNVQLTGRFMRSDRQEFDCVTIDISPGGIALQSEAPVRQTERIVTYLNQVGRLEGTVARTFPGGFAIQMRLPQAKRDRLADQLTWLANRASLGLPEDRRHERVTPIQPHTTVKLPNGTACVATLADVSMSGAAIFIDVQPAVGTSVVVGSTAAQVVRVIDGGIAVEFARPIRPEDFDESIVL
jgi:hypothetical protein